MTSVLRCRQVSLGQESFRRKTLSQGTLTITDMMTAKDHVEAHAHTANSNSKKPSNVVRYFAIAICLKEMKSIVTRDQFLCFYLDLDTL